MKTSSESSSLLVAVGRSISAFLDRCLRPPVGAVLGVGAGLALAPTVQAQVAVDPAGDFLSTFVGPQNGDLDVLSTRGFFDGARFTFETTLNGLLGTTADASYVFGINRGAGTARFAGIGLDQVLFDTVVVARANQTGSVNLLNGTSFVLPTTAIQVNGAVLTVEVPATLLPSQGFALNEYTFNLWPRTSAAGASGLADFAPDNANIGFQAVPEPSTLAFVAVGAAALGAQVLRRRRARAVTVG